VSILRVFKLRDESGKDRFSAAEIEPIDHMNNRISQRDTSS
jgi:hypothetical protein